MYAKDVSIASTSGSTKPGYKKAEYGDFAHTEPGTLAGRYLRRFWQPIYHGPALKPATAAPVWAMSQALTLYRGEDGTPHLLDFRCAHRGAQLSTGWVEGEALRCMYHGWKYDGAGQCVEQPAEDAAFAKKIRIASYPVQEYLGLIFAYLGEGKPPPLPRYPDFEGTGFVVELDSYTRKCNYFNNLENCLDAVHAPFVHRGLQGTYDGQADSPTLTAVENEWGLMLHATRPSGASRSYQFGMPNIFHHKALPDFRESLFWWVPIDDGQHVQFGVNKVLEKKGRPAHDQDERTRLALAILSGKLGWEQIDPNQTDIIRLQDDVAQIGQGVIADRQHERLGRSDIGVIRIRQVWARELEALAKGRPVKKWTRSGGLPVTTWE